MSHFSCACRWSVSLCMGALALVPQLASALDSNGKSTLNDAACWLDPACSVPRGGNSDVMTVYARDPVSGGRGPIYEQIFAFGAEEVNNTYYFDSSRVQGDPAQALGYTTLWERDGSAWSDAFGVQVDAQGNAIVGFYSDPRTPANIPAATFVIFEQAGVPNPVPEPNSSDSAYLTVEYDATRYLSTTMQANGYTATFQSVTAVPEPDTYAMLLVGVAVIGATVGRRARPTVI